MSMCTDLEMIILSDVTMTSCSLPSVLFSSKSSYVIMQHGINTETRTVQKAHRAQEWGAGKGLAGHRWYEGGMET